MFRCLGDWAQLGAYMRKTGKLTVLHPFKNEDRFIDFWLNALPINLSMTKSLPVFAS